MIKKPHFKIIPSLQPGRFEALLFNESENLLFRVDPQDTKEKVEDYIQKTISVIISEIDGCFYAYRYNSDRFFEIQFNLEYYLRTGQSLAFKSDDELNACTDEVIRIVKPDIEIIDTTKPIVFERFFFISFVIHGNKFLNEMIRTDGEYLNVFEAQHIFEKSNKYKGYCTILSIEELTKEDADQAGFEPIYLKTIDQK